MSPVAASDPEPARDHRARIPATPLPVGELLDPPADLDRRPPRLGPGGVLLPTDAPDPSMVVLDGVYHLYSTNTSAGNVPRWASTDLQNWTLGGDVLPDPPAWADRDGDTVWAPSVHRVGGGYLLYYSALSAETGRFCIGVAVSDTPAGAFTPRPRPLVCQTRRGGAIDPFLFTDRRGRHHLLYKTDGNCCGRLAKLWSQPLTDDGLKRAGRPSELLFAGADWEAGLIEGPTMLEYDGRLHLFYSGNWWHTHFYAVGHAVCERITGPCHRSNERRPFMGNRADGVGFGGPAVWEAESGESWLVYHGWYGAGVGYENGGVRAAFTHRIDFPGPSCFGQAATIVGTSASERLVGTPGRDVIVARGGDDVIDGLQGADLICTGPGDDTVNAGRGKDRVDGGVGHDALRGGRGRDELIGGRGTDECWGERLRCEITHPTRHDG